MEIKMSKAFEIPDFKGYYITDNGDVYSRKSGRFIKRKLCISNNGYFVVCLSKDGKPITKQVHRLVAKMFIPNPNNYTQINHKNGIKTDNRVDNLDWCSSSQNILHSYRVLNQYRNKLKPVLQIKDGVVIKEYDSILSASNHTHINNAAIGMCCNKKRKTAGGFEWKFNKKD